MTSLEFDVAAFSVLIAWTLIGLGTLFFLAGSIGLLRFPDVLTRLHALTKADNLGLGLICLGLAWQAGFTPTAFKLLLIWLLALLAGATSCHLVARQVLRAAARRERHD